MEELGGIKMEEVVKGKERKRDSVVGRRRG